MAAAEPGVAQRLEDLEARLAHQDHASLELSNEVYRQQQQIAALERQVSELRDRLASVEIAQPPGNPRDEIPPHY